MNISLKSAYISTCIIIIAGLAGLPVAAMAQQEAIAQYDRVQGDKQVAVVDENRELRDALDRLDALIRCLEAPRNTCVSQLIGTNIFASDSKALPTGDF